MEGNASVYQVNPVTCKTGGGRVEFLRTCGADFDQKGAGVGGTGEAAQFVRGNHTSYKGMYATVLDRMHLFIMYIL